MLFCAFTQAEDYDPILQPAFDNVSKENWSVSKKLLDSYAAKNAEYYLVSSLWYGAENNPDYDKSSSIHDLEKSYSLGSRDAQLLLIGAYLFGKEFPYSNYHKGMGLAADLMLYYENEIALSNDSDGELHRIVGKFYLLGIGTAKDTTKGIMLVKKAAKLGDIEAKEMFSE